jgi:hypothetical protein
MACSSPSPVDCTPPPYVDLSRWGPRPASLVEDCGVAIGAVVTAQAGSARVLFGISYNEPGEGIYVQARMLRRSGQGRLSAFLWDRNATLMESEPSAAGTVSLLAMARESETQVHFLGQATALEPLTFEVREVSITAIDWR